MRIVYNNIIPFKGFLAINLFGVIFVRGTESDINQTVLNHEAIHTAQMKELWYIPFYILYLLEWLMRLSKKGNAYKNITFEKEAYNNEKDMYYLSKRKRFAMWKRTKTA